jgi:hypothetical protein
MQMPARFPGQRNTRRPPDSFPLGTQLSNRKFSIGPWKLELERADYPRPQALPAQVRPIVPYRPPRAFRPTATGSWRERRAHRPEAALVKLQGILRASRGGPGGRVAGPWPLSGQNCTVLLTDVVGFSSSARNDEDRRIIRDALCNMTGAMLQGITDIWSEGRGDGLLTVIWPSIPTKAVIDRLREDLLPALGHHNSSHRDSACFQLRAAVGVGPLLSDAMGPSGDEITTIARLVDAPPFKKAMDSSGASLGIITTAFIYETVIKHDRNLPGYRPVQVDVKTFNGPAWMSVFTTSISAHGDVAPAVAC